MIVLGTELKINIHVEPIDGLHMSDYDFECAFYIYRNKRVVIKKSEMKRVDNDNYIAMIDSEKATMLGRGRLNIEITAYIPDGDFADNRRTEKVDVCTELVIQ
jgi:hypothetical protein